MPDSQPSFCPDIDRYKLLIKELKLDKKQQDALESVIQDALYELRNFEQNKVDRAEGQKRNHKLNDVHSAIDQLISVLGSTPEANAYVNKCMPLGSLEAIGIGASPELIAHVTGRQLKLIQCEFSRGSYGILNGAEILAEYLRQIKQPIETWISNKPLDKGGSEADLTRHYLVFALARHSKSIIGKKATATAAGRFVTLVSGIFQIYNLPDDGVDKLVDRLLRKYLPTDKQESA